LLTALMLSSMISVASAPPVALAKCEVVTALIQRQDTDNPSSMVVYGLHVRFSDAVQQPISRVTFTLGDGKTITDVGTFSPGITINHTLGLKGTESTSCAVTAVEFKDGSMWNVNG
jgi:hypothetical protein